MGKCLWPLENGETIAFDVYDPQITTWHPVSGIYIFAYYDGQHWNPLYIGQADDFSVRIPSHERLDEAFRRGATHVHAAVVPLAANRDTLERRLIAYLQPPMNVQHRGLRGLSSLNRA